MLVDHRSWILTYFGLGGCGDMEDDRPSRSQHSGTARLDKEIYQDIICLEMPHVQKILT